VSGESSSGIEAAVVDRLEGELAVLLVGADEVEVTLPVGELGGEAREGAWLLVRVSTTGVEVVGADPAGEARQRERMQRRMARLRAERGGNRFGR